MKRFFVLLFALLIYCSATSQDSLRTVVAKKGDGIFSILRKEGLNPSKYYAAFISLNEANIKNGSELHLGRIYKIPTASDSFIEKGRIVNVSDGAEKALYDEELNKISLKSDNLSNAVYYLVAEEKTSKSSYCSTIVSELAYSFLVNGAQVYIIKSDSVATSENEKFRFQEYAGIVNKRYLKHHGKYQRLLIVRSKEEITNKRLNVTISHHGKSEEGQKFAEHIQSIIGNSTSRKGSIENLSGIFEDGNDLFLAKNALPAISVIDISTGIKKVKQESFSIYSDKKTFATWIRKGMLNDYAELNIEE